MAAAQATTAQATQATLVELQELDGYVSDSRFTAGFGDEGENRVSGGRRDRHSALCDDEAHVRRSGPPSPPPSTPPHVLAAHLSPLPRCAALPPSPSPPPTRRT